MIDFHDVEQIIYLRCQWYQLYILRHHLFFVENNATQSKGKAMNNNATYNSSKHGFRIDYQKMHMHQMSVKH